MEEDEYYIIDLGKGFYIQYYSKLYVKVTKDYRKAKRLKNLKLAKEMYEKVAQGKEGPMYDAGMRVVKVSTTLNTID